MKRCKKCGTELPDTANFCNVCGASAGTENTAKGMVHSGGTNTSEAASGNGTAAKEPAVNLRKPDSSQQFSTNQQVGSNQQTGNGQPFNAGQQPENGQQYDTNQQPGNGQPFNAGQQPGNGQQFNTNQQSGNGQPFNANQQSGNGQQFNANQQFGNGQQFNANQQFRQAQPKDTASDYYGKQPYIPAATDAGANKGLAICSYFGLLWIVTLITAKNSPFARFHANQSILVFITTIVLNVAVRIFNAILIIISWRFYTITRLLSLAVGGVCLALMIFGIVSAAQGKMKEIPLLGQFHIVK